MKSEASINLDYMYTKVHKEHEIKIELAPPDLTHFHPPPNSRQEIQNQLVLPKLSRPAYLGQYPSMHNSTTPLHPALF